MAGKPPLHVCLVAIPGTLSAPIAGLYEVLTAFPAVAGFHDDVPASPPFVVDIVGHERTNLTAVSGLPIAVQRSIREVERTDIVIVTTMAVDAGWERGRDPELAGWMRRMHEGGALLCSACTGIFVLAETGLLDGGRATTHWAFAPVFQRSFPDVELCLDEVLVTAGEGEEFVMSGGAASWQDLALYLIGRFVNPAASRAIAKFELFQPHAEGQAPYLPFSPPTSHGDALVLGLQQWLGNHFAVASPVAEMTRKSGLSPRAFTRRFKRATGYSPIAYVQRLRVEEAKRRLEQTDAPIDEIAWEVGYEDAAAFRRLFKRIARVTPGTYRRRFTMPDLT
ncbi:MAG: GlxA family transcriptional regulator [Alphaproteobacteria bacterium]